MMIAIILVVLLVVFVMLDPKHKMKLILESVLFVASFFGIPLLAAGSLYDQKPLQVCGFKT